MSRTKVIFWLAIATFIIGVSSALPRPDTALAVVPTFTVNSTADTADLDDFNLDPGDGICSTGVDLDPGVGVQLECTLRAAIFEANFNNNGPGVLDEIHFSINYLTAVGCNPGTGVCTIKPGLANPLPIITDPVTIDGYTQFGTTANSNATGGLNTILKINLDGTVCGSCNGLEMGATTGHTTIKGLIITGFQVAIFTGGDANAIQGNFIGVDATGIAGSSNTIFGIALSSTGTGNIVGGTTAAARNLVSNNLGDGIAVASDNSEILGNIIGLDKSGTLALKNGAGGVVGSGIAVDDDGVNTPVTGVKIGNGTAAGRNIISANLENGVYIDDASGTQVLGNYIGTDVSGTLDRGNGWHGILINNSPNHVVTGNVISGNTFEGIRVDGPAAGNSFKGNYIGLNAAGTAALGNSLNGIFINGADSNVIGGTAAGEGNVISANGGDGVRVRNSVGTDIFGNIFGTNAGGTADLGNAGSGVVLENADSTEVGSTDPFGGNLISGNNAHGIALIPRSGDGSSGNLIKHNLIGVNATNTAGIGNASNGILIDDSSGNTVGGSGSNEPNVIAFNGGAGVFVNENTGEADNNKISRNSIHTNGGLGIDLDLADDANNDIAAPTIMSGTSTAVSGTSSNLSCPSCVIEVFSDSENEGKTFQGASTTGTDALGAWGPVVGTFTGPILTASITDAAGNTSEFSAPFDPDSDNDGIFDGADNCPSVANPTQADNDASGGGDACDTDDDNDGVLDTTDGCDFAPEDIDGVQDADGCPEGATLEVKKVVTGAATPNTFDLLVDGVVKADDVAYPGGTTGTLPITVFGNHTVKENAGPSTYLGNYTTAIVCKSGATTVASATGTAITVKVLDGQTIICTITNTPKGSFAGDHYSAWEVSAGAFTPVTVNLKDLYETKNFSVVKPVQLLAPVNKNGEGIQDPVDHLTCFSITQSTGQSAFVTKTVKIDNQFGRLDLDITAASMLCVPSIKNDTGTMADLDIDHFKCYPATVKRGTPIFQQRTVTTEDQFLSTTMKIMVPQLFCDPVEKKVGTVVTPITHPAVNLVCYSEAYAPGAPVLAGRVEPKVENQFGVQNLQVRRPLALCLPSSKVP